MGGSLGTSVHTDYLPTFRQDSETCGNVHRQARPVNSAFSVALKAESRVITLRKVRPQLSL